MIPTRLMPMGRGGKRLPYDSEVDYLEGAQGARINTDIIIQSANTIRFKIQLPTSGAYASTYQAYLNESSATFRIIRDNQASNKVLVYHGAVAGGGGTSFATGGNNLILEGWTKPGAAQINGSTIVLNQPIAIEAPRNLRFFASNAGRVYYFAVDNQCDFIPVRVGAGANAVGCLYDRRGVGGMNSDGTARNDGLYYNSGTGALVIGPDK